MPKHFEVLISAKHLNPVQESEERRKEGNEETSVTHAKRLGGPHEVVPGVDDLPLAVGVEDDVTVAAVELAVALWLHRNSAAALHPPDLTRRRRRRRKRRRKRRRRRLS